MHALDWGIVITLLVVLLAAAVSTRRYTRSVSAFLVANRCGGRYIISLAYGVASVGVISLVWFFEQNYQVGFTSIWWGLMEGPAMIVMAITGWVIYRFRQTRAMTLAQFFEVRYGRGFRVLSGIVAFLAGVINFGIFPAVGARFFIALCGFPPAFDVAGVTIETFPLIMAALLSISLVFVFLGGQVAVMVTDFIQGIFCNLFFIALIVILLGMFSWDQISETLLAAPAGESKVDPFEIGGEADFNVWYYVISVVIIFYGVLGWQGNQGYNGAAKNAHEAKMAGILNGWRPRVLMLIVVVVPVCVRTMLHHPDFADQAAVVHTSLEAITADTAEEADTLRTQLRTPLALAAMLPTGLLGLMCAAMLALFISTHDTYLHSWGSILIQDVLLPFRKKPFTPRQHLWLLRGSIFMVAVFIFVFSMLYKPTQYVAMFLTLTGSVFFGGAGSAIIGGLYWRRGTNGGAWAAMLTGMTLAIVAVVIKQVDASFFLDRIDAAFWPNAIALYVKEDLNGQELTFWTIVYSVGMYVLVSLLGRRELFDLDRMLHRGAYALPGESAGAEVGRGSWLERLGFTREFTGADRIVTYVTLGWPLLWTAVFVVGTVYRLNVGPIAGETWAVYWKFWTWTIVVTAFIVVIWFTIGGVKDLRYLFRKLRSDQANVAEDGRVEGHANVGEDTGTS